MTYDIKQSVLNRARYNERVNREMYAILSVLTDRARKQEAGSWFRYHDSTGNARHATAGAAFEFLFLHQTHHRGQISQILDSMGLSNNFADNVAYLEGQ